MKKIYTHPIFRKTEENTTYRISHWRKFAFLTLVISLATLAISKSIDKQSVVTTFDVNNNIEYDSHNLAALCTGIDSNALVNTYAQVFTCAADDSTDFVLGMSDATGLSYDSNTQIPNKFSNADWTLENIGNIVFTEFDAAGCLYAPASAFTMQPTKGALQMFGALGGADAIYKMGAISGAPSVWTTLPTSGKGFGSITYDYITNTMYVVNLGNNSIYHLDMSGAILDVFQPDPATLGVVSDATASGAPITNFQNHPYGLDINPVDGRLYYTVVDATGGGSLVVRSVGRDGCGDFAETSDVEEVNFVMENTFIIADESEADPVVGDIDFNATGDMAVGSWSSGQVVSYSYYAFGTTNSMYNHTAGVYTFSESGGIWTMTAATSVGNAPYSPTDVNASSTGGVSWDIDNPDILWMSGGDFPGEDSNWGVIGYDVNQLDAVFDQEDATSYIQFLFDPQNAGDPKGNGGDVDVFSCPPCMPPLPPVVSVVDNACPVPGRFNIDTPCGPGTHIEWSIDGGLTFSSTPPTYDNVNPMSVKTLCVNDTEGCQSTPFEVTTNPTGSCPDEQTCDCTDYIYLNDTGLDYVEKFKVTDSGLVEIGDAQNGMPWLNADDLVDGPHGIAGDANGFLYIGQAQEGNSIQKFTCDGTKIDADTSTAAIDNVGDGYFGFNHFIEDGILYVPAETNPNTGGANYPNGRLIAIDVCTGEELGCLWGAYFWGFTYNEFDGQWYGTNEMTVKTGNLYAPSWPAVGGDCGGFGNGITDVVDINTLAANAPAISFAGYTDPRAQGIVFDDMGNMYIVVSSGFGYAPPSSILKWERTSGIWSQSATDFNTESTVGDNLNWAGARGITYSQSSGLLYVSSIDDCVAAFDTDLVYQPNQSVHVQGNFPKGIGVVTECCPLSNNTVIDTTICTAAAGDTLYLQDILACDGIVCEGTWTAAVDNAALEYDSCDNTIIIVDADNGCGTFTLSSPGGGLTQCGAFSMTMNICVQSVSAPEITITDNDCDAPTPGSFNLSTPCGIGNSPQWSTDGGITWTNTAPVYSSTNPISVIARCADDADATCASTVSAAVTSNPTDCPCAEPKCFGIRIQQN